MADVMDPRAVEDQSQADQENYKVYKRRWLILFAMFSVILVVGLHRSLISIEDILLKFMNVTIDDYDRMTQVSMYTILLSVLAMARALEYFGLRRVAYFACVMIICANSLKALCCCHEKYITTWIIDHRFHILLLSEVFVGLAWSIAICVPAKVASAWFAHYENTLALVIANCGFNIGIGFSNYFTPIFVQSAEDMYKLSYMFIVSAVVVVFIVLTCVTRSSPKMPPSSNAIMSASTIVPLKSGLHVMLTNPSYVLLLFTLSFNLSVLTVEQLNLDDVLLMQQYDKSFCGVLIAHAYFFGTFFMLMAAAWIDNSANYVKVSRISSIICALCIATFNISIIIPQIKDVILVTNVMASFGSSLMYPSMLQVSIRAASSILPESSVTAIVIILQQLIMSGLINLLSPLKRLSPQPAGYQAPMIMFTCSVMLLNMLYITSFNAPSREKLHEKLRALGSRDVLVNEED